ncbi:MAG: cytidine deaminase [Saprospiraceae bacterium]|nr:cytidine deaminase [Saprospiraceae bacterium]
MKTVTLQSSFQVYETPGELAPADRELLELATAALANSYSPYSNFKVGVAIRLANGEMISGSNYENAAYPICICAEQSVLASAASRYPGVATTAIAVTILNPSRVINQPAAPCGACRQVICETEQKNRQTMRVLLRGQTGPVFEFEKGVDLLPLAFGGTFF